MVDLKSLISKLNPLCRQTLEGAAGLCLSRSHYHIEIEHWLLKILERTNSDFDAIAKQFEVDLSKVASDLTRAVEKFRTGNGRSPDLSQELVDAVRNAWLVASIDCGESAVRSGHLLAALLKSDVTKRALLASAPELARISTEALAKQFSTIVGESSEATPTTSTTAPQRSGPTTGNTEALQQFTIDQTERARQGKIDPVVGRDGEIRQIIDILCRRRQNNPILTGEAGVGKTAVVEGLALKVAEGAVPEKLREISIRTLDLSLLQAGAGVRGEFENRLKNVIEEVQASPKPIILFIDEAHNLIGAGGSAGQGDAANLLKPALARGELRTIAATTWAEYKKYFERDAALARRFQVVQVLEPSETVAVQMLRGLVTSLESHHQVRILNEAVEAAVSLSQRYISGRQLPDKAVSVLDTTCARIGLTQVGEPAMIEDARRLIEQIDEEIGVLQREGSSNQRTIDRIAEITQLRANTAANIESLTERWRNEAALVQKVRDLYAQLSAEPDKNGTNPLSAEDRERVHGELATLKAELAGVQGELPLVHSCCDGVAVAETIAAWTGIPVGRMRSDEVQVLTQLEEHLGKMVVGQDHALKQISETIRTGRARLMDPGRPVGVFFLAGTSGVGKTETALSIAELLYGGEQNVTVINMSEFKEEHKVSLLMGSPPGYVGYGEGGVLTEAVRRKPYSVVLLDELEKAHPGVQDIFYQVFDKGQMKDGEGRDIDFRNTIIIMTSNAGTEFIKQLCSDPDTAPAPEQFTELLQTKLLDHFKPAFLGRVTVIPYFPLTNEVMGKIVRLKLNKVVRRVRDVYRAKMNYSEAVVSAIVARCTEVDSGARNVDKILNRTLLPRLSAEFLACLGAQKNIEAVEIDVADGGDFTYVLR